MFLTVNLVDRFLEKQAVAKREVQLVGVAAMLIATKYEEIYPPVLKDLVFITDNAYTGDQVLLMERHILTALDFDLQLTSQYRFLERFAKCAGLDKVTFFLSQFMLELGLLDSKMNQFSASLQAIAAIYTAKKYLKYFNGVKQEEVAPILAEYQLSNHFSPAMVKSCARCFNQLAILIQNSKLQMIVQKFRQAKFYEVGRIAAAINKRSAKDKAKGVAALTPQNQTAGGKPPTSSSSGSKSKNSTSRD